MKTLIVSLAALSCLIQGCGDGKSATGEGAVTGGSTASTVVASKVVNETAINPPALPELSTPLPTENIKNIH